MTQNNLHAALEYLTLDDCSRNFSSSTLKLLFDDQLNARVECIKNTQNIIVLKPGDIGMTQTVFLSN